MHKKAFDLIQKLLKMPLCLGQFLLITIWFLVQNYISKPEICIETIDPLKNLLLDFWNIRTIYKK